MSCSNCFNGCADIVSDQCVKYTGVDIPSLDIHTGDTLLTVENKITDKIVILMDGSGIIPKLDPNDVCDIVHSFMPHNCCPPFTLNDVLTALVKSICDVNSRLAALKERVIVVEDDLKTLNDPYTILCLLGVTADSDTHDIVQAIITKLCQINTSLAITQDDLANNYVTKEELPTLVGELLTNPDAKHYTKMIPWVAVPMFLKPPGAFDDDGAGIAGTAWEKIYICNGRSKTGIPDLRGLVIAGSTTMGPPPYTYGDRVNPTVSGNPTYEVEPIVVYGTNLVDLEIEHMPNHNHSGSTIASGGEHTHTVSQYYTQTGSNSGDGGEVAGYFETSKVTSPNGTHTHGFTIEPNGGGDPHPNVQPTVGAYYIMYIP